MAEEDAAPYGLQPEASEARIYFTCAVRKCGLVVVDLRSLMVLHSLGYAGCLNNGGITVVFVPEIGSTEFARKRPSFVLAPPNFKHEIIEQPPNQVRKSDILRRPLEAT